MSTTTVILTNAPEFHMLDLELDSSAPVFTTMVEIADGTLLPWGVPGEDCPQLMGNVQWTTIGATYAVGHAVDVNYGNRRIAIIDLDNTEGMAVLRITNWVNEIEGATLAGL